MDNPTTTRQKSRRGMPRHGVGLAGLAAALAVGAAALAPASTASAASGWQTHEIDGDTRCFDAASRDADGNGRWDQYWFDLDNDCRWDTFLANTQYSDALLETMWVDLDENGRYEIKLQDTNQYPGFELAYIDDNQDGRYDRTLIPYFNAKTNSISSFCTLVAGIVGDPSICA